jgi:hypothetical protein
MGEPVGIDETVINEGITALARHYGCTEAEITEDLADMSESGMRSPVFLENVTKSLIVALGVLNDNGFDDRSVLEAT